MDQIVDEAYSYGLLKNALRRDLVSCHGFSNPDAGAILNWFNPAAEEYLQRVEAWQRWLCSAVSFETVLPAPLLRRSAFGGYDITRYPAHQIGAIHQVAKMFYKWHGTPRRETNMDEVKTRLRRALPVTLDEYELAGIREELSILTPPDLYSVSGRFGPGATYEGFDAYEKWSRSGAIPDVPPSLFRANSRDPKSFRLFGEGITKIAEVPKTIKSNRIVSSEPAMYMYSQLAVNDDLVKQLESIWPQHVSLADQKRHNRALMYPQACSIDLSDASDHVSSELVQSVLPQFWPVLAKVRSTFSQFPDGDIVQLSTFAPMGSGVCFSVMTTIITGILRYALRVFREDEGFKGWFHVYGDDIIVPVQMYDYVNTLLAKAGLVVNKSKSCCTLVYRESCGVEMFHNMDITPSYIRDPLDQVDAAKVEQVVHRLDEQAFPETAKTVAEIASCIRYMKNNRNLQRLEACVRVTTTRKKVKALSGWDGLNRWFSLRTQGNTWNDKEPSGVAAEVWKKIGWRLRAAHDFPYLTAWFVTRHKLHNARTDPSINNPFAP